MDPSGMVHALEIVHSLLAAHGRLINIQPNGKPRRLEIHSGGSAKEAGSIGHRFDFAMHKAALEAVDQVVREGLFVLEREDTVRFHYRASSFTEFQEWLAENSENSTLDERTARRARKYEGRAGMPSEVVMRQELYMGLLRPV